MRFIYYIDINNHESRFNLFGQSIASSNLWRPVTSGREPRASDIEITVRRLDLPARSSIHVQTLGDNFERMGDVVLVDIYTPNIDMS